MPVPAEVLDVLGFFLGQLDFCRRASDRLEFRNKDTLHLAGRRVGHVCTEDCPLDKQENLCTQTENGVSARALQSAAALRQGAGLLPRRAPRCRPRTSARVLPWVLHDKLQPNPQSAFFQKAENQVLLDRPRVLDSPRSSTGGAAPQSQLDIAIANLGQAEADLAARKADIARAKLHLEYASIRAPINGRIGRALVTEGALVGQNTPTHVATIQQLDPIYADFTQSAAELNELRREFDTGALQKDTTARVRLILDDGQLYPHEGKLLFSDSTVDPGTGQVTLRGEFPNPNLTLLPGMYVRVQIVQGIDPDALAVPQQAVRRNDAGGSEVFLVRDDNRASLVPIRLGHAIDDRWLILDGVKPGDRVIVDGFQKFSDGDVVNPKLWRETRQSDQSTQSADAARKTSPN